MAEPVRKPDPDQGREPSRETNIIGKPFRRVDGRAKVTGATKFADDLAFARMVYVRLVRSTVPHALIRSIDLSEAEKVPGVLGFLTGKNFPIPFGILPVSQDEHALCPDRVRFVGDPVVAVAAVTEDACKANTRSIWIRAAAHHLSVQDAHRQPRPRYGEEGTSQVVSMPIGA